MVEPCCCCGEHPMAGGNRAPALWHREASERILSAARPVVRRARCLGKLCGTLQSWRATPIDASNFGRVRWGRFLPPRGIDSGSPDTPGL
eukprot:4841307-Prymnesium_polylepis.1